MAAATSLAKIPANSRIGRASSAARSPTGETAHRHVKNARAGHNMWRAPTRISSQMAVDRSAQRIPECRSSRC